MIRKLKKSDAQVRLLIETMSDGFVMADKLGVLTFVNDRFCDMLGYHYDEIIGRPLSDFMDETHIEKYQEQLTQRRKGEYQSYEVTFARKNKQLLTALISPKPLFGAEGIFTGSFKVVTDISGLKQTEGKIRKERDFAESLLETAQAIILLLDTQGNIVRFNPYMEEISGYKLEDVRGRNWFEIFLPELQKEKTKELFLRAIDDIQTKGNISPLITKQGVERKIEWNDKTLKDGAGKVIGLLAVGQDITQRLQAEKNLQESEEWQRSVFEGSRDAIFISGAGASFVDVNAAAVLLSGYSKKELRTMSIPDLHEEKDLGPFKTFSQKIMAGVAITSQGVILRKDGTKIETEFSNSRIIVGGEPYMHTTARDISQRSRAEAALRDSEMKYRALFESANDAIFLLDLKGNHVAVNKKAADMLGYDMEDLEEKSVKDVVASGDYSEAQGKLQGLIAGKTFPLYERIFRKKDGTEFPVEINVALIRSVDGTPLYIQSIVRDITARKEAEKRLKSTLKEKEVLLQEIHHRVKNNMQVISSLLRLQAANIEGYDMEEMFQECQNRIRSMALIHDKLYKSKNFSQINFAEYIQSLTLHLFQTYNIKPNTIELKTELSYVLLDLNRAIPCGLIINEIVSNSLKHAFPNNEKGKIWISLHVLKKEKLSIQVMDDGIGLPKDLDFRNPSTLGLQLVNDLVRQISGSIKIDGRKGTRVNISF